ncbi:DUF2478 domain-containing protein [Paracoccus rhizosphaerae]|uniref:DUF2478 domain-containing protein n=1 Tax=Paracoccus rhizosphaerae TaxID=1133347 RepID=A0ABV6CFQ9_9RHOB|nr:DUF2478 domain-containing protein [Paracoccus rhizosphaerae]
MHLGYISLPGRGANDRFLAEVATHLQDRGLRLAGTVQSNIERPGRKKCDMDIVVLPDGPVLRISEDRGDLARGCRLDAGVLEQAVVGVARAMPAADMLIVNKFGKQEAEGRGLAPVIAEALEQEIPVLLGVNGLNLAAFQKFAGGLETALVAETDDVLAWCMKAADHSEAAPEAPAKASLTSNGRTVQRPALEA